LRKKFSYWENRGSIEWFCRDK